jgi:carbonic anhydrase/acetyltransferase-like protein (isoleucine patch superfamily)
VHSLSLQRECQQRAHKGAKVVMLASMHVPKLKCAAAVLTGYAYRIEGEVQVGQGTILHPRCSVSAAQGAAVVIGAKTIIEDCVEITCTRGTMTIGERCLLQVACRL